MSAIAKSFELMRNQLAEEFSRNIQRELGPVVVASVAAGKYVLDDFCDSAAIMIDAMYSLFADFDEDWFLTGDDGGDWPRLFDAAMLHAAAINYAVVD